jgi:hypothetical protein
MKKTGRTPEKPTELLNRSKRFRLFLKYYDAGINAYAAAIRAGYSEAMARGRSYELAKLARNLLGWDDIPASGRSLVRRRCGPMWRQLRSRMI